jgi:hypothetical protein
MSDRGAPGPAGSRAGVLRRLWDGWTRLAHRIGNVQARIILTTFSVAVRALSDPMRFEAPPSWLARPPSEPNGITSARRQY